jgi:hypothetical protein
MTDSELIDWLETQDGSALISDDFGHWAVSSSGMQNVPDDISVASDIATSFFVEAKDWKPSIREAILAAISEEGP